MTDPNYFSVVVATAQANPVNGPATTTVEATAEANSAWSYNVTRAGPPTPPVYPDQQLDPGPVSFFPYPVRDPNSLPLTFSLVTPLPASLQINPSTGEIYGTLDALDWNIVTCQVQVTNGAFTITGPVFRLYYFAIGGVESRITTYGIEYAVHTFTAEDFGTSGQIVLPFTVGRNISYAEYLVIGGGGGGGGDRGGGGGAGSIVFGNSSISIGSYTATVGTGGASSVAGSNSSFGSVIALGGGYGGTSASTAQVLYTVAGGGPPGTGGSGGGGSTTGTVISSFSFGNPSGSIPVNYYVGAAGTAGQGTSGGNGPGVQSWSSLGYDAGIYGGAGGGGAGTAGSNPVATQIGGVGGNGVFVKIDSAVGYYVGGGGAGGSRYNDAAGGTGGGGSFASSVNGTDGTGGGGAGGKSGAGGSGGRGRVVLRYPVYPQPSGVRVFGLVQWLDAASYTSGITWPDTFAVYNATLFNAPVKDAVDGGGCFIFNGTTQYANYTNPLEVSTLSSYSIELWAKWTTTGSTTATIQTLLDNSSTAAAPSFILNDRPDNASKLAFEYRQTTTTSLLSSGIVGDGQWQHIVITADFATPQVRMFINGVLSGTVASPSLANRVVKALTTIGRWEGGVAGGTPRYLNGRVAIIRNYARALANADIINNFNTEAVRFGRTPI